MKKLFTAFALIALILTAAPIQAIPTVSISGSELTALAGPNEDLSLTFEHGRQRWTLLSENAGWRNVNTFGFYNDIAGGTDRTVIFNGYDSPVTHRTTNIAAGVETGFWNLADFDHNGIRNGNEPMVFSTRSLSMGTDDDHYQFFYAFDVSAYRGTDAEFTLANGSRTLRTSGNFDYLIYLDDSGAGPDYDHNDMVVGVSAVPEPATMLLFGLGLAGAGLMRRRHRK